MTIDALDAWWPPTFRPDGFGRTRLAWWTIAVDSQSTRSSIAFRTAKPAWSARSNWSCGADISTPVPGKY